MSLERMLARMHSAMQVHVCLRACLFVHMRQLVAWLFCHSGRRGLERREERVDSRQVTVRDTAHAVFFTHACVQLHLFGISHSINACVVSSVPSLHNQGRHLSYGVAGVRDG